MNRLNSVRGILSRVLALAFVLTALMSLQPPKAHAAGPACYFGVIPATKTARAVDCNDNSFKGMLNIPFYNGVTLTSYQNDHCYMMAEFAVIEIPGAANPAGTPACTDLATWSGTTAATPAKCFTFNKDTLSEFFTWTFDPSLIKSAECSPELAGYYKTNTGTDIPAGSCIVFSNDHSSTTPSCSELDAAIRAAGETTNSNAEKAAAATVGSECASGDDCTGFANTSCRDANSCGFVEHVINPLVRFLAGGVGFVIIIVIIVGGIKYSSSAGDPQKAGAAQKMIMNAVIALVTYIFLYAILRWILPNGVI